MEWKLSFVARILNVQCFVVLLFCCCRVPASSVETENAHSHQQQTGEVRRLKRSGGYGRYSGSHNYGGGHGYDDSQGNYDDSSYDSSEEAGNYGPYGYRQQHRQKSRGSAKGFWSYNPNPHMPMPYYKSTSVRPKPTVPPPTVIPPTTITTNQPTDETSIGPNPPHTAIPTTEMTTTQSPTTATSPESTTSGQASSVQPQTEATLTPITEPTSTQTSSVAATTASTASPSTTVASTSTQTTLLSSLSTATISSVTGSGSDKCIQNACALSNLECNTKGHCILPGDATTCEGQNCPVGSCCAVKTGTTQ